MGPALPSAGAGADSVSLCGVGRGASLMLCTRANVIVSHEDTGCEASSLLSAEVRVDSASETAGPVNRASVARVAVDEMIGNTGAQCGAQLGQCVHQRHRLEVARCFM